MKLYIANWADENTLDDAHDWGLEDFARPIFSHIANAAADAIAVAKLEAMESARVSFEDDEGVTLEWRETGVVELWVTSDPGSQSEPYRYGMVVVQEVEVAI